MTRAFRIFAPFAVPAVLWQGVAAATGSAGVVWRIAAVAAGFGALAWTRDPSNRLARPVAAFVTPALFWAGALEATAQGVTLFAWELSFFPAAVFTHAAVLLRITQPEDAGALDRAAFRTALSAAVLFLSLFLLEGATRAARGIVTYDSMSDDPGQGAAFFRPEDRRARAIPGYRGRWAHRDFAGIRVEVNGWALRGGPEHAEPPPDGRPAVVVLGDSFTFGLGVPAEETYAGRLEDALGARVYNAGIPGYGTFEERRMLADIATVLTPSVVVVGLYQGNDFQDNASAADRPIPPAPPAEPGCLPGPPRQDPLVRLLRLARHRAFWNETSALLQIGSGRGTGLPSRFVGESLAGDPKGRVAPLVERGLAELRGIREDAAALGAELVVLLIPNGIQAEPSRFDAWVALQPEEQRAGFQRTRFHAELARRLEGEGFLVVDPLAELEASAASGTSGFHREGHWNGRGHAIAARLLEPVVAGLLN